MTTATDKATLEARTLVPRERRPLILRTLRDLAPGAACMPVNDHDPKPLYDQFPAERAPNFAWDHADSGRDARRVTFRRNVA